MKRLVILLMVCFMVLEGCGSGGVTQEEYDKIVAERDQYKEELERLKEEITEMQAEKSEEEVQEESDASGAYANYENATLDYEKFNSYARDNGLDGTKIFIEGIAQEKLEVGDLAVFVLKQDDEKLWVVSLTADKEEDEKVIDQIIGERVKIFGIYTGYSDKCDMPASTVASEDGDGKIEKEVSEGKYETVWTFTEYLIRTVYLGAEKETNEEVETIEEETIGESNALKMAKRYLSSSSFSYNGLVKQLEYEGYSHEEAVYGAENCGADWNEQAVKKAKAYLDSSAFSKTGLIGQLEYEGFTHEQAVYGAEQNGY